MKFKLEKDCLGLKKGEDINVSDERVKYMTKAGYIKPIEAKKVKAKKNESTAN